ncbi:MAG: 5'/3'-nucleotidase SurE [Chloroflexi bacterium]|nr:5'/3'-nucleotidase SurE [Chloroflexota bacterium]
MNILVTNDDGINAQGLWILAEALRELGQVTVVAPDREQSGVGASLSLAKPLRLHKLPYTMEGIEAYTVEGTPGDAVIMGLGHVLKDQQVDLVVSGVNQGHNTGADVFLSGTVGAAWHARMRGLPAIAVSVLQLDSTQHAIGARMAVVLAHLLQHKAIPADLIYNVNVPHCELSEIKGVYLTRPSRRTFADEVKAEDDGRNQLHYFLVRKRPRARIGKGADLWALRRKYISVALLNNWLAPMRRDVLPPDFCQRVFDDLLGREWAPLATAAAGD